MHAAPKRRGRSVAEAIKEMEGHAFDSGAVDSGAVDSGAFDGPFDSAEEPSFDD